MKHSPSETIERLESVLNIVEEEFGEKWLRKKSRRSRREGCNPVPCAWAEGIAYLEQLRARGTAAYEFKPNLAMLSEIADDLRVSRSLPNYQSEVRPRIKGPDFLKVFYETHVATIWKRASADVEFIRRKEERTPDLRIVLAGVELLVECTKKERYDSEIDQAQHEALLCELMELQRQIASSYDVIVVVPGVLREGAASDIISAVRRGIEQSAEGFWTNETQGVALLLRNKQPSEPGFAGVILPMDYLSPGEGRGAAVEGTIAEDAQGRRFVKDQKLVSIYAIDTHKITTLVNTLASKRGQIPENSAGMIYLEVDVSRVAEGLGFDVTKVQLAEQAVELYQQMVRQAVLKTFSPDSNTRIGAVILTTELLRTIVRRGNDSILTFARRGCVVRNPHSGLPKDFPIPR